jgi:hypothetical protein
MTVANDLQFTIKSKQYPSCLQKFPCKCFEELLNFDYYFVDSENYIRKVKQQLEFFLYMIKLHMNKEDFVQTPEFTKVFAFIIRNAIYHANLTRFYLQEQVNTYGQESCRILLTSKDIFMSRFLDCFEQLYNVWDSSLVLFFNPSSELPMKSLKSVLDTHYDLIQIYEKFNTFIVNGKSKTIANMYGIQTMYNFF